MLINDIENNIHTLEDYATYINVVIENKYYFDCIFYDKMIKNMKNIKLQYKPNDNIPKYIDYLFDVMNMPSFKNKIREFKLQKIMNYNVQASN
jgi:hypothetical protein